MAYEGSITITDLMDGAPGTPGADGSSVTQATILYYLDTVAVAPESPQPRTAPWSIDGDVQNQWTKKIPTYVSGATYYVCLESEITNNVGVPTYVYGDAVEDNGLTDAATNSSEAVAISRATRQHFWFVSEKTGTIDAGAYITDTPVDTFKQGKTGGYLYASSTGLTLGKDNNTLMALSGAELAFYRPGTSTIDAKLNSKGLTITNGSITLGGAASDKSSIANGSIALTNSTFTRAINGTNRTLQMAIGGKFGVGADGTLYAAGADISGKITVGAGSNVYTTDDVNPLEIGGRNLASKTAVLAHTTPYTETNYVYQGSYGAGAGLKFPVSIFTVGENYVLSFKIKKVSGTFTYIGGHDAGFACKAFYVDAVKSSKIYSSGQSVVDDTNTHVINVYLTYNGNASDNNLYIQPNRGGYISENTSVFQIWDIKIEKGNKATDWTPAPEDVQYEIDAAQTTANNAAPKTSAVKRTQRIYYQNNSTTAPTTPGATSSNWVTDNTGAANKWTKKRMSYATATPYIWTCEQSENAAGTVSYTSVLLDDTTTVIDGGKIITGSIAANQIAANAITTDKIAANAINASKISIRDYNNYVTVNENDANSLVGIVTSTDVSITNGWLYKSKATSSNSWVSPCLARWATPGEQYRVTCKVKMPSAGRFYVNLYSRDANNSSLGSDNTKIYEIAANTVTEINDIITVTDKEGTVVKNNIAVAFLPPAGTSGYSVGYWKELKVERMSGGSLIVDGAITADKLDATTINASKKLTVGAMTTDTQSSILNSNINIGGRNLVLGTGETLTKTIASGTNKNIPLYDLSEYAFGEGRLLYINSDGYAAVNEAIVSFDWETNDTTGTFNLSCNNTPWRGLSPTITVSSANQSGHVEYKNSAWTSTYTDIRTTGVRFRTDNMTAGKTITISNLKIELGNKATDWTPAPEDIQSTVDGAIKSVVSKDQYYLSTSSSSATEGTWQDTVPTWSSGKYIWTRVATTKTPISGSATTEYSTAVYDSALTKALSDLLTKANSSDAVKKVETIQEYYLSTSTSSATGGSWITTVPTWASGKYIWKRFKIITTPISGSAVTTYSPSEGGVYDSALTTALSTASNAAPKSSAVAEEQLIYISKASGTTSVAENTTWVTENRDKQNTWTTKRPTYNSSYPVLFVAKQKKVVSGTVTCTTPVKDDTTTIIDGGHITTGTIDASKVTVTNISASNIKSGTLSADRIAAGTLAIGKLNNDTQNKINNGNSALTKVNYYNRTCHVGNSSNTQTAYWRKFASYTENRANADPFIIFDVMSSGDMSTYKQFGRLKAHIRTAGTVGTVTAVHCTLQWITKGEGIGLSNFVMAYKATSGTDVKIELWCKCDKDWTGYRFNMVQEGDRTTEATSEMWTLYDSFTANGLSAITSGYTQVVSTYIDAAKNTADNYIYMGSSGIRIASADPATQNQRLELTNDKATFYDKGNTQRLALNSSTGVVVGNPNKGRAVLADIGMTIYDENNKRRTLVDKNGMNIYDTDGSTSVASFGATARIGKENAGHVLTASSGISINNANGSVLAITGDRQTNAQTPWGWISPQIDTSSITQGVNNISIVTTKRPSTAVGYPKDYSTISIISGDSTANHNGTVLIRGQESTSDGSIVRYGSILIDDGAIKFGVGDTLYDNETPDDVVEIYEDEVILYKYLDVQTNDRSIRLVVSSTPRYGIYEPDNERWVICNDYKADSNGIAMIPLAGARTGTAGNPLYVTSTGYLRRNTSSSRRYKKDISIISDKELNPERLYDVEVKQFIYRDDYLGIEDQRYGKLIPGFIVEELKDIYPIAVTYEDGQPENWDSRYLVPPMLKLIQDQKKEIDNLKERLDALEGGNNVYSN